MDTASHNKIVSFIWSIADDCLRDVYSRGKYRDVILPMVVLRRLDVLLESTKEKVLEEVEFQQKQLGLTEFNEEGLKESSGFVFYNTSSWTMQKLHDTASNSQQKLLDNFEEYLDGFDTNVKEIIAKFDLKRQVKKMASKDILLDILEKFTSKDINLTPNEKEDTDGRHLPALTNLGMGYVFEELIRKFNEENNEEAGEHFTPREVIDLMTHLVFDPIKENLPPIITIYDPACGSGGMLTEAQSFIKDKEGEIRADGDVYLFGKEINDETYAICKSDMMIKGDDPDNIRNGSTLSTDEFSGKTFNFMLSNPPYGKSWAIEQKFIKDKGEIIDPRFKIELEDYWGKLSEVGATPRSSDGQLLFMMEMVSKMKQVGKGTDGSRIASVHNGSSLFTGDAGGGESNIRRFIIENDYLESIIQMPNNLFYNTGITTYIWLLSNNKSPERKGKVQLIDAGKSFRKLRKNLGNKNCEFSPEHIKEIVKIYSKMEAIEGEAEEGISSKIFDNSDFGYYKVNIERPKCLLSQFSEENLEKLRFDKSLKEPMQWAYETYGDDVYSKISDFEKDILDWCEKNEIDLSSANRKKLIKQETWNKHLRLIESGKILMQNIGKELYNDFNIFKHKVDKVLKEREIKLSASDKKAVLNSVSWYSENGEKVVKSKSKLSGEKLKNLLKHLGCDVSDLSNFGYYPSGKKDEYIQYESESDLRDSENIALKESIHKYYLREVKPHVEEAWINIDSTKIGYEISFNKYFYKHKPLRDISVVSREIINLEKENEGLIMDILNLA